MTRPSHNRTTRVALASAIALFLSLLTGSLTPASAEVVPICFPVLDAVNYTDTFGEARSGGRVHEGQDLTGQKMHRLVSAVDGLVVDLRYAASGDTERSLRIRGDDGFYYAYLHMNNDTPGTDDGMASYDQVFAPGITNGVRVRAGQFVGYMGDSGNAEKALAHLHFEIRRQLWTEPLNPYDSLRLAPMRADDIADAPYTVLGGITPSAPDATSIGPGLLDAFVRGADDGLWHRAWTGNGFTPWMPLGGGLRSGPAAASSAAGRLEVFARGLDDQLWSRTRTAGGWSEWQPLGGMITSDPDATSSGNGDLTVAARGRDGALWYRSFDGGAWGPWQTLGGAMTSGPGIASVAAGQLGVYVRGLDDALWWRSLAHGTSTDWRRIDAVLTSDPDVTVESDGLHVVVRGGDHRLWYLDHTGGAPWTPISMEAAGSGPSIVSWGPDRLDVFVAGTDAALYQTWRIGPDW